MMHVLVACEFSGVVREAFRARGHHAISVDLEKAAWPDPAHERGDVGPYLFNGRHTESGFVPWDLVIAHPPCTYLCNSGVRWLHERPERWTPMAEACGFFLACLNANARHVAVENPVMHKYARQLIGRGPDFTTQPWEHGDGFVKRTCFWTRNLPPLVPTNVVNGREAAVHRAPPGENRGKDRSVTYPGIAAAMAEQWGAWVGQVAKNPPRNQANRSENE